jgi:Kef-type K+ transport system membrane component KefB
MDHLQHAATLVSLVLVFVPAKLLGALFERLRLPGLVGEILAGVLVGPHVLGWLTPNETVRLLAELGVLFLLFRVGLEVKSSELLRVGRTALAVAVAGVIAPFAFGWGLATLWGEPRLEACFIGAAMVATSVGITAQVLAAKGLLEERASKVILAAAVIDDVLGLIILAAVSGLAKGRFDVLELGLTAAIGIGVPLLLASFGPRVMRWLVPRVRAELKLAEAEFTFALILLFSLSLLTAFAGVAAIVGAFLAGLALSETVERRVHELTRGVSELLVPFFLVGIGLQLDTGALASWRTAGFAAAIVVAAVVSKLFGCGLGAIRLGRRDAVRIGVGMVPRGEVGMVVAQIGLGFGVMNPLAYGVIVVMSIVTTLIAPPALHFVYRGAVARTAGSG